MPQDANTPKQANIFVKATLESRHFGFEAYGLSDDEALHNLVIGLGLHASQYGLPADWFTRDDIQISRIEIGPTYRDGHAMADTFTQTSEIPQYRREFPHFGDMDVALPPEFVDESWHNDAMPSFAKLLPNGNYLKLWIDFADRSHSEFPNGCRFVLGLYNQDMENIRDLLESDSIDEVTAFVLNYKPELTPFQFIQKCSRMSRTELNDWYEKNVGYRPDDESPSTDDQLCLNVAEMMFYHAGGTESDWSLTNEAYLLEWIRKEDEQKQLADRRFVCKWPEGYGGAAPEEVDLRFFTSDRGYTLEYKFRVSQLAVGETANFSDMVSVHTVTRIR